MASKTVTRSVVLSMPLYGSLKVLLSIHVFKDPKDTSDSYVDVWDDIRF